MRTARYLTVSRSSRGGGGGRSAQPTLDADPFLDADTPWMQIARMQTLWVQTPLGCRPHPLDADPPNADPPVDRMTDRCKNINLPQTSFAGGKNL